MFVLLTLFIIFRILPGSGTRTDCIKPLDFGRRGRWDWIGWEQHLFKLYLPAFPSCFRHFFCIFFADLYTAKPLEFCYFSLLFFTIP